MSHQKVIAIASRGPDGGVSVSGLLRQALLNHDTGEHIYIATYEADAEVDAPLGGVGGPLDVRLVSIGRQRWEGYNPGWANTVLWGHLLAPHMPFELPASSTTVDEWWSAYKSVNHRLARYVISAAQEAAKSNPVVIAHDYHVLRIARYVREDMQEQGCGPAPPLGLFMHVPWPEPAKFMACPHGRLVVEGMLAFDAIMFQTSEHASNFKRTVEDFGLHCAEEQVRVIPISLDPSYFSKIVPQRPIPAPDKSDNCRAIVAVERVEPVKGALERLRAFERLLSRHSEWIGSVQLFQAGVDPNDRRLGIAAYQKFAADLHTLGEEINHRFGKHGYQPVCTLQWMSHAEMAWLYHKMSDVLVVSSRSDGMNLILQEAAVMGKQPSTLAPLLSKHAGAATLIGGDDGALLFDPLDIDAHVEAFLRGLNMSPAEKHRRMEGIRAKATRYTIHDWHRAVVAATVEQASRRAVP